MIVEVEVSQPFQKRPGRYRSNVQRRWWWLWFAVAVTKGDSRERHQRIANGTRGREDR